MVGNSANNLSGVPIPLREGVVIVAGGNGTRMGSEIPKQFLLLNGKPVLYYTIKAFLEYEPSLPMILVLPETSLDYWQELALPFAFPENLIIASGGKTRTESVINGLTKLAQLYGENLLAAVHDGARPFPEVAFIANCFQKARENGNAVPVTPLADSVREVVNENNFARNRADYCLVQTPQIFGIKALLEVLSKAGETATNKATLMEKAGFKINLVPGSEYNFKITRPIDLVLAEGILKGKR